MMWWLGWGLVALAWVGHLVFLPFDWHSAVLGGFTGIWLASWSVVLSGDRIPDSWRGDRPLSDGDGGVSQGAVKKLPDLRRD